MKKTLIKITGFLALAALMFFNINAFESQTVSGTTLDYAVSMNLAQAEGGGSGTSCGYSTWTCETLQRAITEMKNNGAPCYAIMYQYNDAVACKPSLAYCNTNLYGCN